jgi:hypothetical protein
MAEAFVPAAVVAIDFGTAESGAAYASFNPDGFGEVRGRGPVARGRV